MKTSLDITADQIKNQPLSSAEADACADFSCEEKVEPCVDRRKVKTRQSLRTALINLIEEKGFDALTVGDLCTEASLNRGTFYNHFKDKEDLLLTLENEILAELHGFQADMKKLSLPVIAGHVITKQPLPFLVDLFDYLRTQGDFLHAVLGANGDGSFPIRLKETICTELVRSILHERYRTSSEPLVDYYVSFFASAYMGVIDRWIQKGMQESSEDMALIAVRLFFIKPGESIKM